MLDFPCVDSRRSLLLGDEAVPTVRTWGNPSKLPSKDGNVMLLEEIQNCLDIRQSPAIFAVCGFEGSGLDVYWKHYHRWCALTAAAKLRRRKFEFFTAGPTVKRHSVVNVLT